MEEDNQIEKKSKMLSSLNLETAQQLSNGAHYIIVGCGAAGSVLAARLAEDKDVNVLIVELGPNNLGNEWIETPAKATLLWDHPDGPKPSPTSIEYRTSEQKGRKYNYPRGNGFGGSTNHHSMVDGRGSALIYDNIAKMVNDDRWSYSNVLKYFKKMENYNAEPNYFDAEYHGNQGWLNIKKGTIKSPLHLDFLRASNEVTGAPIQEDMSGNPKNTNGVGLTELQINRDGTRSAAFSDLLLPLFKNKSTNLVILFNTLVTKVLINDRLICEGVECLHKPHAFSIDQSKTDLDKPDDKGHLFRFFAKKEILLCGGAINSPSLLLLSGIGPSAHLKEIGIPIIVDSPGVGTDLMDHNEIGVNYEIDPKKMVWPAQSANIIDKIDDYLTISGIETDPPEKINSLLKLREYLLQFADKTEQSQTSGGIILDWYSGLETDIEHDLHIDTTEGFWYDLDFNSLDPLPDGKLRLDYLRSETDISHPDFLRVFHHSLIEVLRPSKAEGTIRLATADPTVPPILDLSLYKDDHAIEKLARGIEIVRQIVSHSVMKKYYKLDDKGRPLEIFPGYEFASISQLKEYIKRWSVFGHHISGTAKMGLSKNKRAVVDTELRVYGVTNLRVVDNSIFPFPYLHGFNVSKSAYVIAEIVADMIKGKI